MNKIPDLNLEYDLWLVAQKVETAKLLSNPLLQKDIWHTIDDLNLKVLEHDRVLHLNYQKIRQNWLKILLKLYIITISYRKYTPKHLSSIISFFNNFSLFIHQKSITCFEEINDFVYEEYDYHLKVSKLAEKTISNYYRYLKDFLNVCRQEGWSNCNTYWLNNKVKIYSPRKKVEYIPEEVWKQLDECLQYLPEQIQRMVIVIRATGLRLGELLNLSLSCLRQRDSQWRLRFLTEKYFVEDEIPICSELVAIIQEQQNFIKGNFDNQYDRLFCTNHSGSWSSYRPVPKVMYTSTFNRWLNVLAQKHDIKTKEGQTWHFKSHQFRRTVATIMTNAGVRDLIIQKYLRHRSRDMQDYYTHVLKQVLGDEYQELMKETKYVDSMGKLVATHQPNNPITELMRRRMHQISTLYGECHRSFLKEPCQTVNACARCPSWRVSTDDLPYLKQDLARIEIELEIATRLGMVKQQQGLAGDRQSLLIRISGLEDTDERD
jgi:integrase/recombinase XerD